LKNNTKVTNIKYYAFGSSTLLLLFFTSNFKKDDRYLAPLEIFFVPPGCVGLATALLIQLQQIKILLLSNNLTTWFSTSIIGIHLSA